MRFSSKCDYALRVMLELAALSAVRPVSERRNCATTGELARRLKIPYKYLQHVIRALKSAGYVRTRLGEGGGVCLAKDPRRIRVGDIVMLIDGPISPMPCALPASKDDCRHARECVFAPMWSRVKEKIESVLDSVTIGALADKVKSVKMYHI